MECPVCATKNPSVAAECVKCQTPLPISSLQETLNEGGSPEAWSVAVTPQSAGVAALSDDLEKGTVLAGRYEIIQLLGRGGMGAVYKARDSELDRMVALKLIRPELANKPEILRRFKQELILARQVTHRNVIRIFDLGNADNVKFITMDFVDGRDLKSFISERRKIPAGEASDIIRQICLGLEATLTGVLPYRADSMMATLIKRSKEMATPPNHLEPSIPAKINDVVMKCLQINPERRYQNAGEIMQDLGFATPAPSAGSVNMTPSL